MLSVPDVVVVSVLALLLFGPDRLPKVMRQAGRFMRDVQNTSHSFISEMERAAETAEPRPPLEPSLVESVPPQPLTHDLKTEPDPKGESPESAEVPEIPKTET